MSFSCNIVSCTMTSSLFPYTTLFRSDLDSVDFVSNTELEEVLSRTDATPRQVAEAVRVNEEERLRALKLGLLLLAGTSALAILPASRLPRYRPHEEQQPELERAESIGR